MNFVIGTQLFPPLILLLGFVFVIGLFGISLGGIFSTLFGGSKTSSSTDSTAARQAEANRQHEILMAKQDLELAKQNAIVAQSSTKKTLMYVGIGGGLFMMMMMTMMRR